MSVHPATTQISLGISRVWSESSLCAQWVAKDPRFLHVDREDSDQNGRMPRLIWVFAGRTLILLVLSCRGSNQLTSIMQIILVDFYHEFPVIVLEHSMIYPVLKKPVTNKNSVHARFSYITCVLSVSSSARRKQKIYMIYLISINFLRYPESRDAEKWHSGQTTLSTPKILIFLNIFYSMHRKVLQDWRIH